MKALIIIVLLLAFLDGKAQLNHRFPGKVLDSVTRQPVPFTSVSLFTNRQGTFKNIISDSLGTFIFEGIPEGSYYLVINAVGYKRFISPQLTITDSSTTNPVLYTITREAGLLAAVIVQANKPLISSSADGFTYNAANDIIPAGSTANDLLRKIPMLAVDQNGSPMLRGSGNIRVFIDDKPSDIYAVTVADALRQIPAEDIVRIEVILYPSAKYDAEGTDGVINIITRRSRFNAVNGTLRAQVGNIRQNFTPDLNIRNGNWIFNVSAGLHFFRYVNSSTLVREDSVESEKNQLRQHSEWTSHGPIFYSGVNIIYVLNDLHAISGGYRFRLNRDYSIRNADNSYYLDDFLLTAFTRKTDNASGNDLNTFNIGYNGKSRDRKRQYSLLATQFFQKGNDAYDLDQLRHQAIDYKELYRGNLSNKELLLQADYVQYVNDSVTWDAGLKSMFRQLGSINNFEVYDYPAGAFIKDEDRSNRFNYHRNIYALYSNLSWRFNTWQIRVGARYEQTILQTGFKDTALAVPDYKNFVPNILISKTFRGKHIVKWSYGKRITRPYLGAINPAANYSDSFNIQAGNPYLQPEITNRYEIGYTLNSKQVTVMTSLYYNSTHNGIEQVRLPLDGGVFLNTYQNIGKNDVLGLSFSFTRKWMQKLTVTLTANIRHISLESEGLQQSHRGYQYSANFNGSYDLGKGYGVEAMGSTGSPDITLQGKREVWKYYAIVLNKKFKGDKLSMSFRADNFLLPATLPLKQTWESKAFTQSLSNRYQSFYCALSLAWKLGKKEVKAPVIRQETSSDN